MGFSRMTMSVSCEGTRICLTGVFRFNVQRSNVVPSLIDKECNVPPALTHWGQMTHICVGKSTIIGSDNGLSPDRRQAIIWTNAGILLIGPLGTYFSEILTGIQAFSFKKMHLKMSSAKWRSFCPGLNVLNSCVLVIIRTSDIRYIFHHWIGQWFVACFLPSLYNCWRISIPRKKTHECFKTKQTKYLIIQEHGFACTVYPKKYAHGFVVLCFVVVMQSFIMNSHEVFIHIHQGCFAGTGAIVRLPQCQWSKPDGYGKISQCITTTKHSKAKTVCIFLGKYCIFRKRRLFCSTLKQILWAEKINYRNAPNFIYNMRQFVGVNDSPER